MQPARAAVRGGGVVWADEGGGDAGGEEEGGWGGVSGRVGGVWGGGQVSVRVYAEG